MLKSKDFRSEPLERLALLSLTVQFDYTYDTNHFFDDQTHRDILQAAADAAVAPYGDTLDAIAPGFGNTWKAVIDHPANASSVEIPNLTIPANELLVYAGARDMDALGMGGPGGFSSSGSSDWNDLVAGRGQSNTRGADARDFGPWGGSITFDSQPTVENPDHSLKLIDWYFGLDKTAINGRDDFYSVALHEMTHLLGFGTSDAWQSRVSGSLFTGPAAVNEYDGSGNVPLSSDKSHWASGTTDGGVETAMDPDLTTGTRKVLTDLDLAGMDDVGWDIPLSATLSSANSVTTAGAASTNFSITYTHYNDVDLSTLGTGVSVSGPHGFSAPATLVSTSGPGKTVTATYSMAGPGGTFDGSDTGSYTVMLAANSAGDAFGKFAPGGSLGTFIVDIDAPPIASLSVQNVTQLGGATHTITVTYSDISGIDASSIDASDLTVSRTSDGMPLSIVDVQATGGPGNVSPRTVTYTAAAPGGSWDPDDNGTYAVMLNGQQVKDGTGTPADAGTLGTFDVSVGALTFSAGANAVYTDASGDVVTVSLKGPGTGQIVFTDEGNADAAGMVLSNTAVSSSLNIACGGGGTSLRGLTVNGSLKSFTAKSTDFSAEMTASGPLPKLQFRNASGSIILNGGGSSVAITLAAARDLTITSASPIKSIKASEWLDTDASDDLITAPAVSSLAVKGALQAGIHADSIGKVTAGGGLAGADIRATGNIGAVSVGSASDSYVYAGVRSDIGDLLPTSLADFANPAASIKSFTIKGKTSPFINTRVAAPVIGKAILGQAQIGVDVTTNRFGLAADRVASAIGSTSVMGPYKLAKLQAAGSGIGLIDFAVSIL